MRPPEIAAAAKSMATNNRPLPRKTVAKKRSSRAPTRSLTTPTNHRNAIPAKGTRFRAIATAVLRHESVSHSPATSARAGTEILSSTSAEIKSTEKTIPAKAAARGVRSGLPACSGPSTIGASVIGLPFMQCPAAMQCPATASFRSTVRLTGARRNHPGRMRTFAACTWLPENETLQNERGTPMLSGDSGAEPSPPALLAQTWQATLILGALTLILGLVVSFHPTGSLNVLAAPLGILM